MTGGSGPATARHVCPECGCECEALVEELDALVVVAGAAERHLAHVSPARDFDMDHVGLRAALDALRRT